MSTLAQRFQSKFDSRTRSRGRQYFLDELVAIDSCTDTRINSEVWNEVGDCYDVSVVLNKNGTWREAACSCPRFADGYLCKHIWATLLEADEFTDDEFDSGTDSTPSLPELLDELPIDLLRLSYQNRRKIEQGQIDDGVISELVKQMTHVPRALLDAASMTKSTGGKAAVPVPAPWQRWMQDVSRQAVSHFQTANRQPLLNQQTDVWLVLDLAESVARNRPVILFRQRELRSTGVPGKVKAFSLDASMLPSIPDARLRDQLAGLLNWRDPSDRPGYGYQYGYSNRTDRSLPPVSALRSLFPALCATGRLVVSLSANESPADAAALIWDDGGCWSFEVLIKPDDENSQWTVTGQFTRGDETFAASDVKAAFDGGVLVRGGIASEFHVDDSFPWLKTLLKTSLFTVPFADRSEFLAHLVDAGGVAIDRLPESLRPAEVISEPVGQFLILKDSEVANWCRNTGQLYATTLLNYGGVRIAPEAPSRGLLLENGQCFCRNAEAERQLLQALSGLPLIPAQYAGSRSDGATYQFPKKQLPEIVRALINHGWTVNAQGRDVRRSAGSFSMSVSSGIDWFDLTAEIDFGDATVSLPELLKAARAGDDYVQLDDGSFGLLPEDWLKKYGGLLEMGRETEDGIRFVPSQALILDALLAAQSETKLDKTFRDCCSRLKKFDGVKPKNAPRTFQGELREYQQQGLGWLNFLREFRLGGCLADDMGLGKTIQVLSLLEARRSRRLKKDEQRRPSIVVVPKSLVFNWIDEAARFTPKLKVASYHGTERKELRERLDEFDVIVTTYGTLRLDIAHLKDQRFDYAILDEAQAIKNSNSQVAKASRLITADHRLALTGTPIENHLGELWSLFEFLNPGMLGRSTNFGRLAKGDADTADLQTIADGLKPFLLRRTKGQVLTELPDKTEQTLYCEMGKKQRKAYDELRDYYRRSLTQKIADKGLAQSKIHVLEALLRLRQAACHPGLIDGKRGDEPSAKLDMLLEQLEEILGEGHKVLVFSQFTSLLAIVKERLATQGITFEYLDGKTSNRKQKVERFQSDANCPVFLISLKAGGHGLNLTAADYVFILDPWWNPAVEAQAIDRAHRMGQERHVFAYRIICRDTVEERILELQRSKKELADAIISADNSLISSLTAEDLQILLG
ncbi:helicase SNF2 [bacterium]|nr:helicase SNF2 [bacterium]